VNQLLLAAGWAVVGAAAGWFVRWGSVRLARLEELQPGNLRWQVFGPPMLTAILFGVFAFHFGMTPTLLIRSVFILVLVQVIFFDFEHRLILDRVIFPAMALALVVSLFGQPWWAGIAAGLGAGLLFLLLALAGSAIFKAEESVLDGFTGSVGDQGTTGSVSHIAFVRAITQEQSAKQTFAAGYGEVTRTHSQKTAGRNIEFQANAMATVTGTTFVFGKESLTSLEHVGDIAHCRFWKIENCSLHRLQARSVFINFIKNGRLADHEFEIFTSHLFNENGKLKFAAT